ncbi:hypothetical protein, partial [Nonomuraea candida]|uniref:hypothetical protein n=1 Tax=Nonomuraea candida TaxID=359159 RepID=UPI0005BB6515
PEELEKRLAGRDRWSRLEQIGSPRRELDLYEEAYTFLAARGWRQVRIDCRGLDADEVAAEMLTHASETPGIDNL